MNYQQTIIGILVIGLTVATAMGFALGLASGCLGFFLRMVTRGQYNVNDCTRPRPQA